MFNVRMVMNDTDYINTDRPAYMHHAVCRVKLSIGPTISE